jgi:hypothetical protein
VTSNSSRNFVISGLLDACIAAAVILAAGLLGILDPRKSDAVFIVVVTLLGSGCLTEIYRGDVAHVPTTMTVTPPLASSPPSPDPISPHCRFSRIPSA